MQHFMSMLSEEAPVATPEICEAAKSDDYDAVVRYLQEGCDVNQADEDGWNALHYSAKAGNLNIVTELISHGINIDQQSKDGETPLHLASSYGHCHVVTVLLEKGANTTLLAKWNVFDSEPAYTAKCLAKTTEISKIFDKFSHTTQTTDKKQVLLTVDELQQALAQKEKENQALKIELEKEKAKTKHLLKFVTEMQKKCEFEVVNFNK